MKAVADNLWVLHFPLNLLGGHQGRVVTVIRLSSGKLIIHSTGPFTAADISGIQAVGEPAWLVDAMLRHDTFAKEGRAAFPNLPYLAPEGFSVSAGVPTQNLLPPPAEWEPEVKVLLIAGMPKALEHVFLHVPSRTLIVADLVFNFAPSSGWTSFFRKMVMGVHSHPDSARLFPMIIQDRPAYDRSLRQILTWDFDRIIVGHNEILETSGKSALTQALQRKKILPL